MGVWCWIKNAARFMTSVKTWLGYPYPLGATWLGNGVNFALFSEAATSVDLCLFDNIDASQENVRFSCFWPLRSGTRSAIQQRKAPSRSIRESDRGGGELGGRDVWLRRWRR